MDNDSFAIIEFLQKNFGWTITAIVILGFFVVSLFSKGLSEAFVTYLQNLIHTRHMKQLKPVELAHHPIFTKYHFLVNQRLKFINCSCILRKKIFAGLMTIRIEVYDKLLKEYVTKKDEINAMSLVEYQFEVKEFLLKALSEWQEKAQRDGIPQVVIDRFIESTNDIRKAFFIFVESVSNSVYSYSDNLARTSAIFDMLSAFEESLLVKLEQSLDKMDGEISRSTYKGVTCQHCSECPFEKFEEKAQ